MRVAFAGTAPFAELVLAGLLGSPASPVVVVTNPDRPRGRHGTPQPPAIKLRRWQPGLPVLQPERLVGAEALDALLAHAPDVFVACAYGQIVAQRRARRRADHRRAPVAGAALARRGAGRTGAHGGRDGARRAPSCR